ncbi:MAG: SpoIIE family protein phosphatase [Bacteroidia bacterium]|nr:SpoIIE family protein phosphatase [Bacteroidia bacterium]
MKKPVILCVDDEKIILDSLEEQITGRLGKEFDCELAEGGEEALSLIEELTEEGRELAVVISDQLMPSMKGDEFLIEVHRNYPETLKILLTGQASIDAVRNAINNARLYRYVVKPWEENDLMLTVEEAARSYLQYLQLLEHNRLLRSLNKATQEISGEMDLKRLVNKFMQNVIDNTGAEKGFLIVEKDGKLNVEAVASAIQEEARFLHLKLLNESPTLTNEVLQHVANTLQSDTFPDYRIVTPISKKGKNLGYLYLENPARRDVFTYNQREILQMLASQAAISIENANLYGRLEERTKELQEEKDKVESAAIIIEQKNKDITDSIRYARRIQEAMMPLATELRNSFQDSFIFFRPKDIVSGDFYWFSRAGERLIITAADCTGHGVPGAFMSLLATGFLNQVVNVEDVLEPTEIVARLNQRVRQALKQDMEKAETADGMDLALLNINPATREVRFCGARRPLWVFRGEELIEYKGDKQSVGGRPDENTEAYIGAEFVAEPGDSLYFFSDGITDQFGGEDHKKYSTRRFRELIQSMQSQPMVAHSEALGRELDAWRGTIEQTDDILVIGLRFA